jgi:DNA-binding CsgD family transcriptional regulator
MLSQMNFRKDIQKYNLLALLMNLPLVIIIAFRQFLYEPLSGLHPASFIILLSGFLPVIMAFEASFIARFTHTQRHLAELSQRSDDKNRSTADSLSILSQRYHLTKREKEVVLLLLEGNETKAVSSILDISYNTVRNIKQNAYAKLSVGNIAELMALFKADRTV